MADLVASCAFFVGIHLGVAGTGLRERIAGVLGERVYLAFFSLASVAGLVWMSRAWSAAPYVETWGAVQALQHLALPLVLGAFLLAVPGLATPSPTAVGGAALLRSEWPDRGILRVTRHPFLTGTAFWAFAHVLANGDLASFLFFGTLLTVALLGPRSIDRKCARRYGEAWEGFAARTSIVPFGAIAAGRNRVDWREIGGWRIGLALAAYGCFLFLHPLLFGASVLP